jgi:uncharacterized protein
MKDNPLYLIVFFGLIFISVLYTAKISGFFKIKPKISKKTFSYTLYNTVVFIGIFSSFNYFFASIFFQSMLNFMSNMFFVTAITHFTTTVLTCFCYFIYYRALNKTSSVKSIFKNSDSSITFDIFLGIVSWIVIFPGVQILAEITELLVKYVFKLTVIPKQSIVFFLKTISQTPSYFALTVFTISILVPIVEEIIFRGVLQNYLSQKMKQSYAIIITSIIFAAVHFHSKQGYGNIVIITTLFFLSLFLGFLYVRQKSIVTPIALHATFNAISVLSIFIKP